MHKDGIAFVFDDLHAGQNAYCLINNINAWLENNQGMTISAFYIDDFIPCVTPRFARFRISELNMFDGSLISTSFRTSLAIQSATRAKRFYYITDKEWERSWFKFDKELVDKILNDKDIVKIVRSPEYLENAKLVEDYDIQKFVEITNEKT